MPVKAFFKAFAMLLCLGLASQSQAQQADASYKLSSGDILKINVFGEPDLSFDEIRLNDAGTFSYPFVGEIEANGKTPGQIQKLISSELQKGYLVDPRVSVSVITYREFYISGEVKTPGGYPYQPGLTLDRAIALAGGLTERGSSNRISITRGAGDKRTIEKAQLSSELQKGYLVDPRVSVR